MCHGKGLTACDVPVEARIRLFACDNVIERGLRSIEPSHFMTDALAKRVAANVAWADRSEQILTPRDTGGRAVLYQLVVHLDERSGSAVCIAINGGEGERPCKCASEELALRTTQIWW